MREQLLSCDSVFDGLAGMVPVEEGLSGLLGHVALEAADVRAGVDGPDDDDPAVADREADAERQGDDVRRGGENVDAVGADAVRLGASVRLEGLVGEVVGGIDAAFDVRGA